MPEKIFFADYEFDVGTGELKGPAGSMRLQPQPAKVLAALLAGAGQLVTRDELKRLVWPETVVEADQGLNFCVRQIRTALGDEADAGRYIETLPRRGYRLAVPIRAGEAEHLVAVPAPAPTQRHVVARWAVALGVVRFRWWLIAAAILWIVVDAGRVALGPARDGRAGPPIHQARLAVLPFVAPSGEAWMVALNRDLTDRLVARLVAIDSGRFGVVGPVTTGPYAGDTRSHTEIGAKLRVDLVLSGGIRSKDSTLFVQIIRVSDGVHVVAWREHVWNGNAEQIVTSILAAIAGKV